MEDTVFRVIEIPQERAQFDLRRLQQVGKINRLDTKAQAKPCQARLVRLAEATELLRDIGRRERSQPLEHGKGQTLGGTGKRCRRGVCRLDDLGLLFRRRRGDLVLGGAARLFLASLGLRRLRLRSRCLALRQRRAFRRLQHHKPAENLANMLGHEFRKTRIQALRLVDRQQVAAYKLRPRCIKPVTTHQPRHHGVTPADIAFLVEPEGRRRRCGESADTGLDLVGQAAARGRQDG